MKRNAGFTLVELIVGIAVASIVTAAATTLLLMGLRMNKASSDTATRQNTARIVLTVLEDLASEQNVKLTKENGVQKVIKVIENSSESTLFSCEDNAIYIGDPSETPIMTDVKATITARSDKLLELKLEVVEDGETVEEYTSSVYCRLATLTPETGASVDKYASVSSLVAATKLEATLPARQKFLEILTAELGSTGASVTTGEYFSEWYIGSYEENPAWDPDTPWCACFLSWALSQCGDDLRGVAPRYANVDSFMGSFDQDHWKTADPNPGDLIFFDWQTPYDNPEHVGAVTEVWDGYVYTIEGNSNGKVETCRYSLDDPRILGYGILNWK